MGEGVVPWGSASVGLWHREYQCYARITHGHIIRALARVTKLVDVADLKFAAARRAGSIPAPGTKRISTLRTPRSAAAGIGVGSKLTSNVI